MRMAPTSATTAPGTARRGMCSWSTTPLSAATNSGCVHTSATEAKVDVESREVIQVR